jgi:hypothetical protein
MLSYGKGPTNPIQRGRATPFSTTAALDLLNDETGETIEQLPFRPKGTQINTIKQ